MNTPRDTNDKKSPNGSQPKATDQPSDSLSEDFEFHNIGVDLGHLLETEPTALDPKERVQTPSARPSSSQDDPAKGPRSTKKKASPKPKQRKQTRSAEPAPKRTSKANQNQSYQTSRLWIPVVILVIAGLIATGIWWFNQQPTAPPPVVELPPTPPQLPDPFAVLDPASLAPPQEHPSRIFTDDQNQIFVPHGIPLYLRLSTDPDTGATSFLLHKTQSSDSSLELNLSRPGENILSYRRWDNNPPDLFSIFSDAETPVTTLLPESPVSHNLDDIYFFISPLELSLSTTDDLSGTAGIYVSLDGVPFEAYRTPLTLNEEKRYLLRYYSVDQVGNTEPLKEMVFYIDLTPPTTEHVFQDPFLANTISPATTITFTSNDQLSGVARINYRFDDASDSYESYIPESIISLPQTEGDHTLVYFAEDNLGNKEQERTTSFYLDATPPEVTFEIDGDLLRTDAFTYVSTRTRIKLSAKDDRIGVQRIDYRINDQASLQYTDPLALPAQSGLQQVTVTATDRVMNRNEVSMEPIYMDMRPPTSKHVFNGPTYILRDTLYISAQTMISFDVEDMESGVHGTEYRKNDARNSPFSVPFNIPEAGFHQVYYASVDRVNNQETDQLVQLMVDNEPPVIFHNFSTTPYTRRTEDGEQLGVYAQNSTLFLAATDVMSGASKIYYSINNAPEVEYTGTVQGLDRAGLYTLNIRAVDNVANVREETLRFFIGGGQ